jgi:hypothetical protein
MAANTAPIFSISGDTQWGGSLLAAANAAYDGTGAVLTVFTAGADGGYVNRLIMRAAGTNIQTVLRVFLNNGSTNATAANNSLIGEMTLYATTASNTASTQAFEYPLNFALPAGYKVNVTIATTVAAGYYVTAIGGKY